MADDIAAHDQKVTNSYVVHFPDHQPRQDDPHYAAFECYRRQHQSVAVCDIGRRVGFDTCADATGLPIPSQPSLSGHGLELHHSHIEFSLINGVDLSAVVVDFPGLDTTEKIMDWAETDQNLMWLCAKHHRGHGGIHHASYADYTAEEYIRNLIS